MNCKLTILALAALAACETTTPTAQMAPVDPDLVVLPPAVDSFVADEAPAVVERKHVPKAKKVLKPGKEFEPAGIGIIPLGCTEYRENDPEAECR